MTDMRLLCVLIAASLIAPSTALPPDDRPPIPGIWKRPPNYRPPRPGSRLPPDDRPPIPDIWKRPPNYRPPKPGSRLPPDDRPPIPDIWKRPPNYRPPKPGSRLPPDDRPPIPVPDIWKRPPNDRPPKPGSRLPPDDRPPKPDTSKLKDLLSAMKQYLRSYKDISSRMNAHDDVRTVYAPSSSANAVSQLEAAGSGHWSQWLDVDPSPDWGTGEYENSRRIRYQQDSNRQCYVGCKKPLAMRYSVVDAQTPATWTDIENCIGEIDSRRANSYGFTCRNSGAHFADKTRCRRDRCSAFGLSDDCSRCPNVRVQFFCSGRQPNPYGCCSYADSCSRSHSSLQLALADYFSTDDEKRDVIANILHARGVLKPQPQPVH